MTLLRKRAKVSAFEPSFPENLRVDVRVFCVAFPFHIVFDSEMRVVHSGVKVGGVVEIEVCISKTN